MYKNLLDETPVGEIGRIFYKIILVNSKDASAFGHTAEAGRTSVDAFGR